MTGLDFLLPIKKSAAVGKLALCLSSYTYISGGGGGAETYDFDVTGGRYIIRNSLFAVFATQHSNDYLFVCLFVCLSICLFFRKNEILTGKNCV